MYMSNMPTGLPPHTKPGTVIDKCQSSASSDCATGCMIHTMKKKSMCTLLYVCIHAQVMV